MRVARLHWACGSRNLPLSLLHGKGRNPLSHVREGCDSPAKEGRATRTAILLDQVRANVAATTACGHPFCECGCGRPIGSQAKRFISGHNATADTPPRLYGPANWRWSGGPKQFQLSPAHRLWRARVFARDDWRCQRCGARASKGDRVRLNAHHIVPIFVDATQATDLANGITLCEPCHRQTHRESGLHPRKKRLLEDFVVYRSSLRSPRSWSRSLRRRAALGVRPSGSR